MITRNIRRSLENFLHFDRSCLPRIHCARSSQLPTRHSRPHIPAVLLVPPLFLFAFVNVNYSFPRLLLLPSFYVSLRFVEIIGVLRKYYGKIAA